MNKFQRAVKMNRFERKLQQRDEPIHIPPITFPLPRIEVSTDVIVILVGPDAVPVKRIDPKTREATHERQQFRMFSDGHLEILPQSEWVEHPNEYHVGHVSYR